MPTVFDIRSGQPIAPHVATRIDSCDHQRMSCGNALGDGRELYGGVVLRRGRCAGDMGPTPS